jgi:hypothetical protein
MNMHFSSFNVSDNATYMTECDKMSNSVGFHAPDYNKIQTHKRILLFGINRTFKLLMN